MPKYDNTVQFSLPSEKLDKLRSLAREGESIGLVAKRMLLAVIDGGNGGESDRPAFEDLALRVSSIEEKVDSIELAIECEHFPPETVSSRLAAIEERLNMIEILSEPIDRPDPIAPGIPDREKPTIDSIRKLMGTDRRAAVFPGPIDHLPTDRDPEVSPVPGPIAPEVSPVPGPIAPHIFVVCHLSPERSILGYWGGKAEWVTDRSHALTFDTESKAKAQLTRSRKKYPVLDIRYNSIANLQKLDGR